MGRTVGNTVTSVATLGCLQARNEPPRLHIEATFYRVGAEEVKAVSRGESTQQVTQRLVLSQALPPWLFDTLVAGSPHVAEWQSLARFPTVGV